MAEKRQWNIFFEKSWRKVWWVTKISVPLHSQFRNEVANKIGVWCNGNTTDSGPVILGSSPSIPTNEKVQQMIVAPFCVIRHFVLIDYVYATVHKFMIKHQACSGYGEDAIASYTNPTTTTKHHNNKKGVTP